LIHPDKLSFFHDPKIKKLRRMAGGDTYTIILQKIMLLSIKDGGIIEFQGIEKTLHEELALILMKTLLMLKPRFRSSSIEALEEDRFLLPLVPHIVGSESDSAERVRKLREKRKSEMPALQSNGDVTSGNEIVTAEKEKKLKLEIRGDGAYEEYLLFRMAGEGIQNPIAFKKIIMRKLQDPTSDESNDFEDWRQLMNMWPKPLDDLCCDLVAFGRKNRKICREIAKDHANDFGVEVTPMMFEIAFYESCKTGQRKEVA
jgi:predicted phage replisome organizer